MIPQRPEFETSCRLWQRLGWDADLVLPCECCMWPHWLLQDQHEEAQGAAFGEGSLASTSSRLSSPQRAASAGKAGSSPGHSGSSALGSSRASVCRHSSAASRALDARRRSPPPSPPSLSLASLSDCRPLAPGGPSRQHLVRRHQPAGNKACLICLRLPAAAAVPQQIR